MPVQQTEGTLMGKQSTEFHPCKGMEVSDYPERKWDLRERIKDLSDKAAYEDLMDSSESDFLRGCISPRASFSCDSADEMCSSGVGEGCRFLQLDGFVPSRSERSNSSDSAVVLAGDDDLEEGHNRKRPSVIISDYSELPCERFEIANGTDDQPTDFLPVTLDDIARYLPFARKLSTCSTCSTISNLSGDEEQDEERTTLNGEARKKPSAWKKLRNIVHWSPFVQTYKKQRYPWVQLAGHQGNFKAGSHGTILKKLCGREEICLEGLMNDTLKPFIPNFKGRVVTEDGEIYLELQDLLADFDNPCVLDVKMGVRTYLEDELAKAREKPKLRKDMYDKMIQIDSEEPTEEEHSMKAVTKPRYMVWRETISSTASLGFRIEGIKKPDGTSSKDFKTTKSKEQVSSAIQVFVNGYPHALGKYLQRLKEIRSAVVSSEFFHKHEFIGSSLLFVHDKRKANIWLIDFAKTWPLPEGISVSHDKNWTVGNHEDGYLIGIDNLITLFQDAVDKQK